MMARITFTSAHEREIEEYLAGNPGTVWNDAFMVTADTAYERLELEREFGIDGAREMRWAA